MTSALWSYVCPVCKGELEASSDAYSCAACRRDYPIVLGIPDFRLETDPFISIADDRMKARHLAAAGEARTFEQLVRYYYSITPEDPPDLAERWTRHHFVEVPIAAFYLDQANLGDGHGRRLIDLGCSTGALLVAARQRGWTPLGVDVALRWMVIGQHRLREAGIDATFVCANAHLLPFPDAVTDAVTATDLLEHVREPYTVLREARRVSAPNAVGLFTANNRYAPLLEPQMRLWGVGYLPRRWQSRYVARRRPDVHTYRLKLPSAVELRRLVRSAGFERAVVDPAPLTAPHVERSVFQGALRLFNAARLWPVVRPTLRLIGPKLMVTTVAGARSTTPAPIEAAEN